ncbi:unnamed protein product [Nyctereutes procyonoides]|uniref:(raccoon dog) hypothetical protein n=1 Tax=Nyctereutes procyonoides TaxID=34880 RepID=A0A811ZGH5_NYCPR|nr:unnamed protein product [Nyctereutes procyonoides]
MEAPSKGSYILSVLQETEEERVDKDSLLNIYKEIVEGWSESQNVLIKPMMVSEEKKQRKAKEDPGTTTMIIGSNKSLFQNTNVEDVLNAQKLEQDSLQGTPGKKEQDTLQSEGNKLAKQEHKEGEKKEAQRWGWKQ